MQDEIMMKMEIKENRKKTKIVQTEDDSEERIRREKENGKREPGKRKN